MSRVSTVPLMVALEETHGRMKKISPVPLGGITAVAPRFVADAFGGSAIVLNGRRVRVEICEQDGECVYLVRDVDLEWNRANA